MRTIHITSNCFVVLFRHFIELIVDSFRLLLRVHLVSSRAVVESWHDNEQQDGGLTDKTQFLFSNLESMRTLF